MKYFWTAAAVTALLGTSATGVDAATKHKKPAAEAASDRTDADKPAPKGRKARAAAARAAQAEETSTSTRRHGRARTADVETKDEDAEPSTRGRRTRAGRAAAARDDRRSRRDVAEAEPDARPTGRGGALRTEAPDPVKVGKGDTLFALSRKTGVDRETIAKLNGLKPPYHLQPGQEIKLPSRRYYAVQKGDTISSVAKRLGTEPVALAAFNETELSGHVRAGEKLYVPDDVREPEAPKPTRQAAATRKASPAERRRERATEVAQADEAPARITSSRRSRERLTEVAQAEQAPPRATPSRRSPSPTPAPAARHAAAPSTPANPPVRYAEVRPYNPAPIGMTQPAPSATSPGGLDASTGLPADTTPAATPRVAPTVAPAVAPTATPGVATSTPAPVASTAAPPTSSSVAAAGNTVIPAPTPSRPPVQVATARTQPPSALQPGYPADRQGQPRPMATQTPPARVAVQPQQLPPVQNQQPRYPQPRYQQPQYQQPQYQPPQYQQPQYQQAPRTQYPPQSQSQGYQTSNGFQMAPETQQMATNTTVPPGGVPYNSLGRPGAQPTPGGRDRQGRPTTLPPQIAMEAPSSQPSILKPTAAPTMGEIVAAGRGRFVWPVRGAVLSGFGRKAGGQSNDGLNIAAQPGEAVRAAAAGEVVYAGDQVPSFGNLVLVKHANGWVTAYAHMSGITVKNRDQVGQGQQIGIAGNSGNVGVTQLHFEMRYSPSVRDKATPIDPMLILPSL